jgi:hypothetical protein
MVAAQNLFWESTFPKSYFLSIRGYSWHKNEIKMIRRGCYRGNNFQVSTKAKITENKTLGYLPRVLFFNAFQLGAESRHQVFSSEEALMKLEALHLPLLPFLPFGNT